MATKKPSKDAKNSAPPKRSDDDEDVLFEGELTWTHDPIPVSPELSKRTPRDEEPSVLHYTLPTEGSIEMDKNESSGEIFSNDPEPSAPADTTPEPADSSDPDAWADEPIAPEGEAAPPAPDTTPAAKTSGLHGRMLMPREGFNKASVHEGELADSAGSVSGASGGGAPTGQSTLKAGEFAPSDTTRPGTGRRKWLWVLIVVIIVALIGAAAAYVFVLLPRQPDQIFLKALANSFQQPNTQFAVDSQQSDKSGRQRMHFTAAGTAHQAGGLDMTASLSNPVTHAPLNMAVRSTNGSDGYVQFTNLLANQAYMTELGLPATVASHEGQWLSVSDEVRSLAFTDVGLGGKIQWNMPASDQHALAAAYQRNQFLRVSKTLDDEPIEDEASHHYQLTVDKTQLTAFLIAAKNTIPSSGISQVQIDAANRLNTDHLQLEVWVGTSSKRITQFRLTKPNEGGTFTFMLTLPAYTESPAVAVPNATGDVLGAFKSFAGPRATDADAKALLKKVLSAFSASPK